MTITKLTGANGYRSRKAGASGAALVSQRDRRLAKEMSEAKGKLDLLLRRAPNVGKGKRVVDDSESGSTDGVLDDLDLSDNEVSSDNEPPRKTPVNTFCGLLSTKTCYYR